MACFATEHDPMKGNVFYEWVAVRASMGMAVLGFALLLSYMALGHTVIKGIYKSHFSIVDQIMEARKSTPIESYLSAADEGVLKLGSRLVLAGALAFVILKNPLGVLFSGASFLIGSFAIFCLLDMFPAFVKPLHLDIIPYFNYRLTYVPDPMLGFRERPFNQSEIDNFRGFAYSPVYGIDVQPRTMTWQTDQNGFRNPPASSLADVAVIGSSFVEYGSDLADTYPQRLEKKLGGSRVVNLGKAGYGPLQFLEVLKRYGLEKRPRYVILAFYPPGDADLHLADFTKGRVDLSLAKRHIAFGGFLPRYRIAVEQVWRMLNSGWWTVLQVGFRGIVGRDFIHPDVAVLRLPNNVMEKVIFLGRHAEKSVEDLLHSPEWIALEKILVSFKQVSEQNRIVPLILYIPAASEIYAEYSTSESGVNWLKYRDTQIATIKNNEEAARQLAQRVGIQLINLVPAFKQAAGQSKLVYYRLDDHWNSEGREIAARVTAEVLQTLSSMAPKTRARSKSNDTESNPQLESILQQAKADLRGGIMLRTLDGKINFWNPGAEQLYGWSQREAVGKVSHDLLRTQFPEPLEKIDAQLVKTGRWEGTLVHITRDGRRVVVESQWVLESQGQRGSVVEINTPVG
jgi:PAS domain S-box-containing protein